MKKPVQKEKEIELEADAWQRFERAVDVVSKSPPQHRVTKKKKTVVATEKNRKRTGA